MKKVIRHTTLVLLSVLLVSGLAIPRTAYAGSEISSYGAHEQADHE